MTVSRVAQFVLRFYITGGLLEDTQNNGCYVCPQPQQIQEPLLSALLFEAVLHAIPAGTAAISSLMNEPALFPFSLYATTGDFAARLNPHLEAQRFGMDDELLKLVLQD